MKNLNTYITEKFKISKNTKATDKYYHSAADKIRKCLILYGSIGFDTASGYDVEDNKVIIYLKKWPWSLDDKKYLERINKNIVRLDDDDFGHPYIENPEKNIFYDIDDNKIVFTLIEP